jgi:peroxiredoxin
LADPRRARERSVGAEAGRSAAMNTESMSFHRMEVGDPAPWFTQRTSANPRFVFDTAAGRYIVLCFFATASDPAGRKTIDAILANRRRFDDDHMSFFGVSLDPADESEKRVADSIPGIRYFWDVDASVSRLYGVVPVEAGPAGGSYPVRRGFVVLDPTLRTLATFPLDEEGNIAPLLSLLDRLPPPDRFPGFAVRAPVLVLPNVFEPDFCRSLIGLYEAHGGEESGFMRQIGGNTVAIQDRGHKQRRDFVIEDEAVVEATRERIRRRVAPEIRKIHQFEVTRMERYIVSCYAAAEGGHFSAHRDNTTKGTAHRRFAVSINLNDDFEGGEVSFPEYGERGFKMPTGGAVVFSCSLLHRVSPVTAGRRFAFLPFLYDEAAARIREANLPFITENPGGPAAVAPAGPPG